jgi:prepilin-type N-terminal cleavage/methylation domain-containing protein
MSAKKYATPDGVLFLGLMKLQLWRTAGAKVMERFFRLIKIALPLAIMSVCLFGVALNSHGEIFREFQAILLSVQWMLLVCLAVWCGSFIFLTFTWNDLPLIGLLLIAIIMYFIGYAWDSTLTDAIVLLAGVTAGRGTQFLLKADGRWKMEDGENNSKIVNRKSAIVNFLVGLVMLLAFGSWWHLDMLSSFYHGPRWMGLWDNPNIYGMLMGAGLVLAIGLIAASPKSKVQSPKSAESAENLVGESSRLGCGATRPASNTENANDGASLAARGARALPIVLFIAAGMMAVGLFFSYSRGAWVGTAVGLLYLAKAYGRFKWRYVVICFWLLALGILLFWGRTPDNAPWYMKRMDFGRPSAQHRVAAWKAGFEIMRDHPLGVGWNKAVDVYQKNYSPPENGAAALTMNSYLMLGTELGLPGLLCFIWLCFKKSRPYLILPHPQPLSNPIRDGSKTACRAGALVLLVAFWFDGGLFTLATASVFWILLEVGSSEMGVGRLEMENSKAKSEKQKMETFYKSQMGCRKPEIRGFTLTELLVVIAVIAILAALLLPVLSRAKMRGTAASCLNNQKQLALAWHMYADDNGDRIVNFSTYYPPSSIPLNGTNTPWRTGLNKQLVVTVPAGYSPEQAYIYKIEMGYQQPSPTVAGPLFKYAPNPHIVHCPGDKRYNLPIGQGFAWDSYSGVTYLNGEGGGFTKESQIVHPSDRFLWAEGADGRGENEGSWVMFNPGTAAANFSDARFGDSPAAFHVTSGTFSFADGHAESHRWEDGTTIAYANSVAVQKESNSDGTQAAAQDGSVHDQQWVGSHYPGPQNP